MAPFVVWCARQFNLAKALIVLSVLSAGAVGPEAWAQSATPRPTTPGPTAVRVTLDQARIIKVPERTTTLVVGNPLIADVSVQAGGTLVITGKSYGVTNLVAMDRTGQTLLDTTIEVQGPGGHVVVMYRGIERETYSCTPNCERRITLGDSAAYFAATADQSEKFSKQAQDTQKK